ncbi:MAG TPA: GAF domain-containing protein [Cyclobacteriaceae bacterium]|nr:GAF domain-containing protein [Cyclobacteriaceae bacterium]
MAEQINIPSTGNKEEIYQSLLPQVEALISGEEDLVANLSNIAAALKYGMKFFWVGFYVVKKEELVLGPFQGPVACTRIAEGRGVCGTSMKNRTSIIVPDVNKFPGHIACSSEAKSEIVIPAIVDGRVVLVLDVDSEKPDDFDQTDLDYLGKVVSIIEKMYHLRPDKTRIKSVK